MMQIFISGNQFYVLGIHVFLFCFLILLKNNSCSKTRREHWSLFSSYSCWQHLVDQTRTLSKDHAALSEIYSAHLVSKLSQVTEDIQRIYKKVFFAYCTKHFTLLLQNVNL